MGHFQRPRMVVSGRRRSGLVKLLAPTSDIKSDVSILRNQISNAQCETRHPSAAGAAELSIRDRQAGMDVRLAGNRSLS